MENFTTNLIYIFIQGDALTLVLHDLTQFQYGDKVAMVGSRYTRSEITREQYQEILADLN